MSKTIQYPVGPSNGPHTLCLWSSVGQRGHQRGIPRKRERRAWPSRIVGWFGVLSLLDCAIFDTNIIVTTRLQEFSHFITGSIYIYYDKWRIVKHPSICIYNMTFIFFNMQAKQFLQFHVEKWKGNKNWPPGWWLRAPILQSLVGASPWTSSRLRIQEVSKHHGIKCQVMKLR